MGPSFFWHYGNRIYPKQCALVYDSQRVQCLNCVYYRIAYFKNPGKLCFSYRRSKTCAIRLKQFAPTFKGHAAVRGNPLEAESSTIN